MLKLSLRAMRKNPNLFAILGRVSLAKVASRDIKSAKGKRRVPKIERCKVCVAGQNTPPKMSRKGRKNWTHRKWSFAGREGQSRIAVLYGVEETAPRKLSMNGVK
jgi:hypothetical protein